MVWLPAFALLRNWISAVPGPTGSFGERKFCTIPELLITPAPLMERMLPGETACVMTVNALAPGLKTMLPTSMLLRTMIVVKFETLKVAVSLVLLGTVAGLQLLAFVHWSLIGTMVQAALPASAARRLSKRSGS